MLEADIFFTHLYFRAADPYDEAGIEHFVQNIKKKAEEAKSFGKDLVSNECGWGDFTDEHCAQRVKITLDTFKKYNIGYTLYALNASDFPDLHDEEDGPLSPEIGNLAFINKNGEIRPGHEIVNEY